MPDRVCQLKGSTSPVGLTARLRRYPGRRGMQTKLQRLLRDFDFVPLGSLVRGCLERSLKPECGS